MSAPEPPRMTIAEIITTCKGLNEMEVFRYMSYTDIAALGHIMDRLVENKNND